MTGPRVNISHEAQSYLIYHVIWDTPITKELLKSELSNFQNHDFSQKLLGLDWKFEGLWHLSFCLIEILFQVSFARSLCHLLTCSYLIKGPKLLNDFNFNIYLHLSFRSHHFYESLVFVHSMFRTENFRAAYMQQNTETNQPHTNQNLFLCLTLGTYAH